MSFSVAYTSVALLSRRVPFHRTMEHAEIVDKAAEQAHGRQRYPFTAEALREVVRSPEDIVARQTLQTTADYRVMYPYEHPYEAWGDAVLYVFLRGVDTTHEARKSTHDERRRDVILLLSQLRLHSHISYGLHIDMGDASIDDRVLVHRPANVRYIISTNLDASEGVCGRFCFAFPISLGYYRSSAAVFSVLQENRRVEKTRLLFVPSHGPAAGRTRQALIASVKNWLNLSADDVQNNKLPLERYIRTMSDYRYALSLEGAGKDCTKTWEALLLGCVPLLQESAMARQYARYLPVLMISADGGVQALPTSSQWWQMNFEHAGAAPQFALGMLTNSFWRSLVNISKHLVRRSVIGNDDEAQHAREGEKATASQAPGPLKPSQALSSTWLTNRSESDTLEMIL